MWIRIGIVVLCAWVLSACATFSSVADGNVLRPDQGLLAFKVDSNSGGNLAFVQFEKESTFGSRFAESMVGPAGSFVIKSGATYFVVPVAAGEYMWSRFTVYPKAARFHSSNRFAIKAGTITYIGHVRIFTTDSMVRISALDREAEMREHLKTNFPKYVETLRFEKAITEMRL